MGSRATKRLVDVVGVLMAGILLSPVMVVAALAVLLTMGRPVLYVTTRAGIHGRPFRLVKFRTMRLTPEPDGQRITSLGRLLRQTSLDELPELWNVLRGEMSLVGPRPLYLHYIPLYTAHQARRLEVRPGLTGWAQVKGRNALSWEERFDLDVWYADHRSLWLDLKILAMTAPVAMRGRGVSAPGHATMPEFIGSDDDR